MAKYANTSVMDAALAKIATGIIVSVCNAQPTTYTEATATFKLASTALVAGNGNGDYTFAAGSISGRKVTMTAKSGVSVASSGTATHIAICDGSTLLYVTTCTSQVLTAGNTVTIPAWKIEIADPS